MVDPKKIEAVRNWVRPSSVTKIRSFVGLASYYCRFVKNFAYIATHLTSLTKKEVPFEWTEKCEKRFQRKKGGVLVRIEVRATFIEEIKAKQFEDENLNELRNKTVIGKAQDMVLDAGGVLSFKERICVPRVGDLFKSLLTESHGSRNSIHPGVTKMYRDLK
ncbi:hypothetical protein MTR67_017843 [Solanum verrucosum]|uniref:Uncharacterized protein n=1 Tax=Solanum verrucosum TaxID=315347 RepID=A0AAF0TSK9_SOLVR|nr:hypothetical protein MTR67_017843 [Solanum verrucosum]